MIKFMAKCFFLVALLLTSVLFGMQHANNGIRDMKGYNDPNFEGAFRLYEDQFGDIEAAVLGTRVTSHDIKEKQSQLESMEAFNLFSSIGSKLADGLSIFFQKVLNVFTTS